MHVASDLLTNKELFAIEVVQDMSSSKQVFYQILVSPIYVPIICLLVIVLDNRNLCVLI